jgi:hypothetical protein
MCGKAEEGIPMGEKAGRAQGGNTRKRGQFNKLSTVLALTRFTSWPSRRPDDHYSHLLHLDVDGEDHGNYRTPNCSALHGRPLMAPSQVPSSCTAGGWGVGGAVGAAAGGSWQEARPWPRPR